MFAGALNRLLAWGTQRLVDPRTRALLDATALAVVLLAVWFHSSAWYRDRLLAEQRAEVTAELSHYATALRVSIEREVHSLERAIVQDEPVGWARSVHLVGFRLPSSNAVKRDRMVAEFVLYEFGHAKSVALTSLALGSVLEPAGLLPMPEHLSLAIRTSVGEVFYGEPQVSQANPVILYVGLPGDYWEIAAVPLGGWMAPIRARLAAMSAGLLLLFLGLALLLYQVRRRQIGSGKELRQRNAALQSRAVLERLLIAISKDLIGQPVDALDDTIQHVLEIIGAHESADRSHISMLGAGGHYLEQRYEWCAAGIEPSQPEFRRAPLDAFPRLLERVKAQKIGSVERFSEEHVGSEAGQQMLQAAGLKSAVSVPMLYGGQTIGLMGLQSLRRERQWSEESVTMLRLVADMLASALKRKEAEAALRLSEERYRTVADHVRDVIYTNNLQTGEPEFTSPSALRVLGFAPDELREMGLAGIMSRFHPDDMPRLAAYMQQLVTMHDQIGFDATIEYRWRCQDETYRWYSDSHSVILGDDGRALRIVGSLRDITADKESEHALRRSEGRYRTVVEVSRDVIYVRNMQSGAYEFLSPATARVTGFSSEEIQARGPEWVKSRMHPDDQVAVEGYVSSLRAGASANEDSLVLEYRWLCADGVYHWFSDSHVTVRDATGELLRHVGSMRDITERKQNERRLLESEARFRNLFESIGDALILLDENLRVVDYKDTADRVIGLEASEVLGKRFEQALEVFGTLDQQSATTLREIMRSLKPAVFNAVRLPGRQRQREVDSYLDVLVYPVSLGGRPHAALLCRDVTELRRLEAEAQQTLSLQALGRLALDVAHDFNKYLTVISAEVELLEQQPAIQSAVAEELGAIASAVQSGVTLARELVTFGRGEAIRREILHMNLVVEETAKMLRPLLNGKVSLQLVLSEQPIFFWGDQAKFERILVNLASNALNAMPSGGSLTIETQLVELDATSARARRLQTGPHGLLIVRDTGVGINEQDRLRIFEPFFTTERTEARSGLGLPVVYGIVQQHQGHVFVESELGQGTAFHLYFPAIGADLLAQASDEGA